MKQNQAAQASNPNTVAPSAPVPKGEDGNCGECNGIVPPLLPSHPPPKVFKRVKLHLLIHVIHIIDKYMIKLEACKKLWQGVCVFGCRCARVPLCNKLLGNPLCPMASARLRHPRVPR